MQLFGQLVASLICLVLATALNVVGLSVGKWLHNVGAAGCWLPAVALIVLGLFAWAEHGPATSFTAASFVPEFGLKEAVAWPLVVLSLTGLEAASILGDEIRDTRKLTPALIFGAVLSLATKVAATLAALAVVRPHQLAPRCAGSLSRWSTTTSGKSRR